MGGVELAKIDTVIRAATTIVKLRIIHKTTKNNQITLN